MSRNAIFRYADLRTVVSTSDENTVSIMRIPLHLATVSSCDHHSILFKW